MKKKHRWYWCKKCQKIEKHFRAFDNLHPLWKTLDICLFDLCGVKIKDVKTEKTMSPPSGVRWGELRS